jgi:hypothetical protein
MAAEQQIEAAVDALVAKLRDGLDDRIDEINAEAADDFALPHVPDERIVFGPRSEPPYPFISVLPGPDEPPVDASGRVHWRYGIDIVVWLENYQEEALARQLVRMARAVREVAMRFRRPGSSYTDPVGGYGLQYRGSEPGPSFAPEGANPEGAYVSWTRLSFDIQQQQDL